MRSNAFRKLIGLSLVMTLAVIGFVGCGRDNTLAPPIDDGFPAGETPGQRLTEGLSIGPIEGYTTGWHALPKDQVLSVPRGVQLDFRYKASPGSEVRWIGAIEVRRDDQASYAKCPAEQIGKLTIGVDLASSDGRVLSGDRLTLQVVEVEPRVLAPADSRITARPVRTEYAGNAETMKDFFGGSVAELVEVGQRHYRTSVGKSLSLSADVADSRLAWLTEWRLNGAAVRLGSDARQVLRTMGSHVFSVGPPAFAQELRVDVYEVEITSHVSDQEIVPVGREVTFTAKTRPPGFESDIRWLASTKFGTATPATGRGTTFTVTFADTWGGVPPDHDVPSANPLSASAEWLGVKADHVVFNQDQKVPSLGISQSDLSHDGVVVPNSDWGSLDLNYSGFPQLMYLNLSIDGSWQIQNVPVQSVEGHGVFQSTTYNFALPVQPGNDLTSVNYGISITTVTLASPPASNQTAFVADRAVRIDTGIDSSNIAIDPAHSFVGGLAFDPPHSNQNFPNQECGVNECVPAAVSNSLQFLNDTWGLGMAAADIDIDDMKGATGWSPFGCPVGWPGLKDAYMQANGLPVTTTTTTDIQDVIDALDADCDVEITAGGHCAAVVGVTPLCCGGYIVDVKHDTDQGNPGGTKTESGLYDANNQTYDGPTGFNDAGLHHFTIECPAIVKTP